MDILDNLDAVWILNLYPENCKRWKENLISRAFCLICKIIKNIFWDTNGSLIELPGDIIQKVKNSINNCHIG